MNEQSLNFVKRSFREFYFNHAGYVETPSCIDEREFGYMDFNGAMTRHLSFKGKGELDAHLLKTVPSDVYCSCAYYSNPTAPIQEKIFRGADLIFDIDADDLQLPCARDHEVWICNDCRNVMRTKQNCMKCNSTRVEKVSLACDTCMDEGRKEVLKLIKVLQEDLGIKANEIKVYFSGNHGFHLHVFNKDFESLDSHGRADIADYVMGNNLMPETFGVRKERSSKDVIRRFPGVNDYGWRGRIARQLMDDDRSKHKVVQRIIKTGYPRFKEEINNMAREMGARIDPKVTMDIHRVFRLQGTLNSKSGLSKAACSDIENFDPFTDGCVLSEENVKVYACFSRRFRLRDSMFGPYKNQEIDLPTYAAVYLICKGLAEVQL
jgi:DNA primase small subunit